MKRYAILTAAVLLAVLAGCDSGGTDEQADFTATVAVLSGSPTPIAPVAWAVHTADNPFFTPDTTDRVDGLEALAEDGDPGAAAAALPTRSGVISSGLVNTPDGSTAPGPAGPGASYSFDFSAEEGDMLSFATMYVQSNDLFYGPGASGVDLFPAGQPISGDITMQIILYDAGTEINEEPGTGPNQAPRQAGPDTGADENGTVRNITDVSDGFTYPAVDQVIMVTITVN